MRAKNYNPVTGDSDEPAVATELREKVTEKIRLIAQREDQADDELPTGDMRRSVRKVLERFQQAVIQRNIWIRIYDDQDIILPIVDSAACQVMEAIIRNAIQRHQSGKMLAYVEISFLVNEVGTVITVEDNGQSLTLEEIGELLFLQRQEITTLPSGYTMQATIGDANTGGTLGKISVRCVASCFMRFTVCLPH